MGTAGIVSHGVAGGSITFSIRSCAVKITSLFVVLSGFACGESERSIPSPTSPDSPPSANASGVGVGSNATAMSGRVVNAVDGRPLSGVKVEVPDVLTTWTQEDGSFELSLETSQARLPLILDGANCLLRETHIGFSSTGQSSSASLELNVLPEDGDFDLVFFDHLFRGNGSSGTERWTIEPKFEIWTKVYDCIPGDRDDCEVLLATDQDAPDQFVELARMTILSDVPKCTGSALMGTDISTASHPPGERLSYKEYLRYGTVTFVMIKYPNDTSFARVWPYESGRMYSASVQMNKQDKSENGVYTHELAHALGFSHPLDYGDVPLPSIMRTARQLTRHDILHGRILYMRPPGSRSPDKDPEDFDINALRFQGEPPLNLLKCRK